MEYKSINYFVKDVYRALDAVAPFDSCCSWDNVGLLVGTTLAPLTGVLVTLDVTPEAIDAAEKMGANCIVSHHPVIFQPIKRVEATGIIGECMIRGISVISAHTNYDFAPEGVNFALASALGLQNIRPFGAPDANKPYYSLVVYVPVTHAEAVYAAMSEAGAGRQGNYSGCAFMAGGEGRFLPELGARPYAGRVGTPEAVEETRLEMLCAPEKLPAVLQAMREAHPYEEPAFSVLPNHALHAQNVCGMIGELPEPLEAVQLVHRAEKALGTHIQYTPRWGRIETVAVCGGAGSDFMDEAQKAGAEAFLTGEVKHHKWFQARERGLCVMAGGHHATEHIAMPLLAEQLRAALPEANIEVFNSNPTRWG